MCPNRKDIWCPMVEVLQMVSCSSFFRDRSLFTGGRGPEILGRGPLFGKSPMGGHLFLARKNLKKPAKPIFLHIFLRDFGEGATYFWQVTERGATYFWQVADGGGTYFWQEKIWKSPRNLFLYAFRAKIRLKIFSKNNLQGGALIFGGLEKKSPPPRP